MPPCRWAFQSLINGICWPPEGSAEFNQITSGASRAQRIASGAPLVAFTPPRTLAVIPPPVRLRPDPVLLAQPMVSSSGVPLMSMHTSKKIPGLVGINPQTAALFGIKIPGFIKKIARGALDFIPGGRTINQGIDFFTGPTKPGPLPGTIAFQPSAKCTIGFEWDPVTQRCIQSGFRGAVERFLPGGELGTQEDIFGEAVQGRFGVGLVPGRVNISTRRCPRGMKLGKDGICYDSIANSNREWPRGTPPLLTGGQVRSLRKAAAARTTLTSKRGRKLIGAANLKVVSR